MSALILVVEDNEMNRELLTDWLEGEGYDVVSAASLQKSFEAMIQQPPSLVLLDISLGREDGTSLVLWMRQKPEFCEIPVLAVTAHALPAEKKRILMAGCEACLSKPIDFQQLREELRSRLARSRAALASR